MLAAACCPRTSSFCFQNKSRAYLVRSRCLQRLCWSYPHAWSANFPWRGLLRVMYCSDSTNNKKMIRGLLIVMYSSDSTNDKKMISLAFFLRSSVLVVGLNWINKIKSYNPNLFLKKKKKVITKIRRLGMHEESA